MKTNEELLAQQIMRLFVILNVSLFALCISLIISSV